jgi:type II secretory pathway component PulJ
VIRDRDQRGFSIVDMLVGAAVAMIIGAAGVAFVRSQSLAMRTQATQLDLTDASRSVVELMAREIRLAGYNPRCLTAVENFSQKAITEAESQRIRIEYDLNENGQLDAGAAASEDVTYRYVAETRTLERVVGGTASVLAGDIPASGFQIRYFLSLNGMDELVPPVSAANRPSIKLVSIRLEPERSVDTRVDSDAHASLWTNVLLRNREHTCQ